MLPKIRAWDRELKKMLYSSVEQFDDSVNIRFEQHFDDEEPVYMRGTGIVDRAGNEIYEGDIIKWGHVDGSIENPIRIAEVQIDPDIQFVTIKNKYVYRYGQFFYRCHKAVEVIGNIYANPELLNGAK